MPGVGGVGLFRGSWRGWVVSRDGTPPNRGKTTSKQGKTGENKGKQGESRGSM